MISAPLAAKGIAGSMERAADYDARVNRVSQFSQGKRVSTREQAEKVAQDFEALFLSQMLEHMFSDSLGDDFFGSEETSEFYRGLMVEEYGKQITRSGGIGVADYVKQELLKLQEVPSGN